MPIKTDAPLCITAFKWVPDFAQGFVRDLRPRWACEEIGLDYAERLIDVMNKPADFHGEQHGDRFPSSMTLASRSLKAAPSFSISRNRMSG